MIDLKPYGAFIEYTIRPLIEEIRRLCKDTGIPFDEKKFASLLNVAAHFHFQHMLLGGVVQMVVTAMLCTTAIYLVRCTISA